MKLLGYGLIAAGAICIFYVRLSNIDVTETRLFIDNFDKFALSTISVLVGYFLVREG